MTRYHKHLALGTLDVARAVGLAPAEQGYTGMWLEPDGRFLHVELVVDADTRPEGDGWYIVAEGGYVDITPGPWRGWKITVLRVAATPDAWAWDLYRPDGIAVASSSRPTVAPRDAVIAEVSGLFPLVQLVEVLDTEDRSYRLPSRSL